jgi:pantetheine-phosphate adenylyltransferase
MQMAGNEIKYAGMFDPFTKGHLWMLEQASKMFNLVYVRVADNIKKKPEFTLEERVETVTDSVRHLGNVSVRSLSESRYLVEDVPNMVNQIRGLRNTVDFEYERMINDFNRDINPNVTTLFLIPPPEISRISSSAVKSLIGYEGWEQKVEPYLTKASYNSVLGKYRGYYKEFHDIMKKFELKIRGADNNIMKKIVNKMAEDDLAMDKLVEKTEDNAILELYDEVVRNYSQRQYHNMVHIAHSLNAMCNTKDKITCDRDLFGFAIWMHDIIYVPGAKYNEEKSADIANMILKRTGVKDEDKKIVNDLILETKNYLSDDRPDDINHRLIRDMDLIDMAAPYDEFVHNQRCIFYEYDDAGAPDEIRDFDESKSGMKKFLRKFLDRNQIYWELTEYEGKARDNITEYIKSG